MIATLLAIALGTLVSEDLACVTAGVLVQQGSLPALPAMAACAAGIWIGDLGLWGLGRLLASSARRWAALRRYVGAERETFARAWVDANAGVLIIGSRFLPGTRLPIYVAAGALGRQFGQFACWSFVAVMLWTPPLVLLAAGYVLPLSGFGARAGSIGTAVAALAALIFWRVAALGVTDRGRQRLVAGVSRIWRWEFWPMWLFYAPVVMWIGWLAIRHRGLAAISAANPGMPDGGIVGESKHDILTRLPEEWTIPSFAVEPGATDARVWQCASRLTARQWSFPLVIKPDVGQRGAGVKIVRTLEGVRDYVSREPGRVVVQPYHPGPFEAGVFYFRMPGEAHGRILSITDKHFPVVVGNGRATLEELIWADRRLRMQARTFLSRHAPVCARVLAEGERMTLAIAGNHAQGTLFKDGRRLITAALEERIDAIARQYPGFYVGRFDIRYANVEQFKAGEDLAIVELNGATAESTNIYDPDGSLFAAYRQLFTQWSIVFAIGAANLKQGTPASSFARLVALVRAHRARRLAFETSD